MNDWIKETQFAASVVFDDFNERLRVEDYRGSVLPLIHSIKTAAQQKKYSKLIVKARNEHVPLFIEKGFRYEGWIQGYFHGSDAHILTYYFQQERRMSGHEWAEDQMVADIQTKSPLSSLSPLPDLYKLRNAQEADAVALVELYRTVFKIYPSPLHELGYMESILKKGALFCLIEHDKQIVSAASAEVNRMYYNAELTDCATLPEHREHGLMKHLLRFLEMELKKQGIFCAYSLARAQSYGMNAAFHQLGYRYSGRLINNCYIFNDLEDMNIWVKDLSAT
ncbi:putative beta-lysine N-acetyltransferase [Anoxybacillus sp. B7M1]|jgi:beta-lysine N6-acetyltransferase|uniref:Beta-lysine N-acetyltransferase n=1 Tax=Anoxybacteroides rupiense TaxID=311460 RepID=A0ABD5ISZ8_9BACL|nr:MULTISPECIES: putative beta-lysine N-acetyltransferase [Anoxybacillus]ANB55563.1 putative beta-lysine N-acetyltransferase [Anoxybacillus sp. B2M1]ANB64092.1 putative beta-lysine N-acetyltransferase [Anoxybacillus sp. B7M1]KXG09411.1 N-acetyltransferase YodP [Anoxybacillus sp. P3H1B]MBS2771793.1 putative beta-lysine N-acetyltransferase [Anoxybacillus rupiensis]MED5051435.1 putative beta-lysine N-acetyltransferase [Anoxybacillus rupiensis]